MDQKRKLNDEKNLFKKMYNHLKFVSGRIMYVHNRKHNQATSHL